jgi:hypothetical protein
MTLIELFTILSIVPAGFTPELLQRDEAERLVGVQIRAQGVTVTALPDADPHLVDVRSRVQVRVVDQGEIPAIPPNSFQTTPRYLLIGHEVVMARDSTRLPERTYELSYFFRGQYGTSALSSTHAVGERVVEWVEETPGTLEALRHAFRLERAQQHQGGVPPATGVEAEGADRPRRGAPKYADWRSWSFDDLRDLLKEGYAKARGKRPDKTRPSTDEIAAECGYDRKTLRDALRKHQHTWTSVRPFIDGS